MNAVKIGIDLGGTKVLIIAGSNEEKHPTGLDFTPFQLEEIISNFIEKHNLDPVGIAIEAGMYCFVMCYLALMAGMQTMLL